MIDIHAHVIPYIDDGSQSMEDSIKMLKDSASIGVTDIICTPHHIRTRYEKSAEEVRSAFDELVRAKDEAKIPVNLYLGQEIHYSRREDIADMIETGKALAMNDKKFVLIEFSYTHEPEDLGEVVYVLHTKGYEVIIAHAERYDWMTLDIAYDLKNDGAYIQVNANAILGIDGGKIKRLTKKLLKNGLVDCIASDMHSFRPSNLDKAYKVIKDDSLFNGIKGLI